MAKPVDPRTRSTNDGADSLTPALDALVVELEALLASWEYAYAMGHGCSVGDHPRHQAVRRRVADLRARIAEHTA